MDIYRHHKTYYERVKFSCNRVVELTKDSQVLSIEGKFDEAQATIKVALKELDEAQATLNDVLPAPLNSTTKGVFPDEPN